MRASAGDAAGAGRPTSGAATAQEAADKQREPASHSLTTDARLMGGSVERDLVALGHFADPSREWRRLIAELVGTFLLVIVGAYRARTSTRLSVSRSPCAATFRGDGRRHTSSSS